MPTCCAASNCTRRSSVSRSMGITFHRFPVEAQLRLQWENALKKKGFIASKRRVLCSEHFKPEDFDRTGQTVRLREGSIPSIFKYPQKARKGTRTSRTSTKAMDEPPKESPPPKPLCTSLSLESQKAVIKDHSYALPQSSRAIKNKLDEALARAEKLQQMVITLKRKEQRANNMLAYLLKELEMKDLQNENEREDLQKLYFCSESQKSTTTEGQFQNMARRLMVQSGDSTNITGQVIGEDDTLENEELEKELSQINIEGDSEVKRQPIDRLWKGRAYEDSSLEDRIRRGLDAHLNSITSNEGLFPESNPQDDQIGDQGDTTKPKLSLEARYRRRRKQQQPRKLSKPKVNPRKEQPPPVSCKDCGKTFRVASLLKRHEVVHLAEKPFVCELCGKGFYYKNNLVCHMRGHTGERPYTCEVCGRNFIQMAALKAHQKVHQHPLAPNGFRFQCDECGKGFNRRYALRKHQVVHTGERPHGCEVCGKRFTIAVNLRRHMRIHTGEKPWVCEICGMGFNQPHVLTSHQKTHTRQLLGLGNDCETCGRHFDSFRALTRHWSSHRPAKVLEHWNPLTCVVCTLQLPCADSLETHLHSHEAVMPCTCSACKRSLDSLDDLRFHQQQHTMENPSENHFMCDVCGKTLSSIPALRIHQKTHAGEKMFDCDICGKKFTTKASARTHKTAIHTGEKPFSCDTCGKSFNNPGNLTRHKLIHTGIKPYRCTLCGRCFNQGNSLKLHQQTHTGEKPHKCDTCGKGFSDKRNLKKHKCL